MTTTRASTRNAVPFDAPRSDGATAARQDSAISASTYTVPAGFMGLADAVTLIAGILVAWRVTPAIQWIAAAGLPPFGDVAWIPLVMIPATLVSMYLLGGYRPVLEQSRARLWLTSGLAPLLGLSVVTLIIITVRNEHTSRALIVSLSILPGAGLLLCRLAVRRYKSLRLRAGHYAHNVLVIAASGVRPWVSQHFATRVSPHAYRLYGYLEVEPRGRPARHAAADADGPPVLGTVDDLVVLLANRPIHDVLVVPGSGSEAWLPKTIEHCDYFQVGCRLVPELLLGNTASGWPMLVSRGPLYLPEIALRPGSLDAGALLVKRIFDIVVSAALLTLLSPLFLLIAAAIKITTPRLQVFYPWRVVGYKGRPFTGYKFTTMHADADRRVEELRHLNEMQGPVFKMKADPRVTPLGRVLRKYSLNELPQLWSVLKGDMSLVGPRPAYPNELARYELWQRRKLCVQPGITCLWQVRGRNKITSFDDWVRMDFEYIDHWSLWLDCKILIRTAWTVVMGTGL